jgi:hypothetical protein
MRRRSQRYSRRCFRVAENLSAFYLAQLWSGRTGKPGITEEEYVAVARRFAAVGINAAAL